MLSISPKYARIRLPAIVALCAFQLAALSLIPARQANAAGSVAPSVVVPGGKFGSIFSSLPVSDLGLQNAEVAHLLSGLSGLGGLEGQLKTVVTGVLKSNPNATMQELTAGVLGNGLIGTTLKLLKVGVTPSEVFEALSPSQLSTLVSNVTPTLTSGQLTTLLSATAGGLAGQEAGSFESILSAVTGGLSAGGLTKERGDLVGLLSGLSKAELTPVLEALKGVSGAGGVTGLLSELQSHSPSQLTGGLESLVDGLDANGLSALVGALSSGVGPAKLEGPLHDVLGGLSLSPTTGEALAGELGVSVQSLGESLQSIIGSSTPMVSAPLGAKGPVLGLLSSGSTLKLALLSVEELIETVGEKTEGGTHEETGSTEEGTEGATHEETGGTEGGTHEETGGSKEGTEGGTSEESKTTGKESESSGGEVGGAGAGEGGTEGKSSEESCSPSSAAPCLVVPNRKLGSMFSSMPVSDLGLQNAELAHLLSGLPGLSGLEGELGSVVSGVLKGNPNATVQELTNGVLGNGLIGGVLKLLKVGMTSGQVFEALSPAQLSTLLSNVSPTLDGGQLATLLSATAGGLTGQELGSFEKILAAATGSLPGGGVAKLHGDLAGLLSGLSKAELTAVLEGLESVVGASSVSGLLGELQSHSPSQLTSGLEGLVGGLDATEVSALFGKLAGVGPAKLEGPLSDVLGGLSLSPTTGEALAGQLGVSLQGLGESLQGVISSVTPMVSAPLGAEGPILGLLNGASALKLSLLSPEAPKQTGGEKPEGKHEENTGTGTKESKGSGSEDSKGSESNKEVVNVIQGSPETGHGTNGNAGSQPGQNTINVFLPQAQNTTSTAKAVASAVRIKILSHRVKGKTAILVLQVPGAGLVTVTGAHVTKASHRTTKAGRLQLKLKLTAAGLASLRRHNNLLRVVVRASFKPRGVGGSSAITSLRFR